MSRRRDPVPLKVVKGAAPGRDSGGRVIPEVPRFSREAPDPPEWLPLDAYALWIRVAPSLDKLDLLKDEDREAFTAYCLAWQELIDARKLVKEQGYKYTALSGVQHLNPAVLLGNQASLKLLKYACQFGLTPAAEIALAKPGRQRDTENPFDEAPAEEAAGGS